MISTRKDGDSPFWWYLPEKMEIFHGDLLVYRRVYNQRFQGTNLGFNGRLDFRGTGGSLSLKSSDSSFSCWTSWKISKCVLIFFNATPLLPSVPPPLFFTKKNTFQNDDRLIQVYKNTWQTPWKNHRDVQSIHGKNKKVPSRSLTLAPDKLPSQ